MWCICTKRRSQKNCPDGTPIVCSGKKEKDLLVSYLENNKIQTRNYFKVISYYIHYSNLGDWMDYRESNKVLDKVFWKITLYGRSI